MQKAEEWNYVQKLEKEKEVTGIYLSGHPLDQYRLELLHFINCTLDKVKESDEHYYCIAGMVTEVNKGVGRERSLPYCRFTLQDLSGSFSAGLYRENYSKYADLITMGQVIYIEGRYRKVKNADRYYFNLSDLRLLATVAEEKSKTLTLRVPIDTITEDSIRFIENVLSKYEGEKKLKINLYDESSEENLSLVSRNVNVNICSELIYELEELGVKYKLN